MSKKPVGIRAAYIGGVFLIVTTIITGLIYIFTPKENTNKINIISKDSSKIEFDNKKIEVKGDYVEGDKIIKNKISSINNKPSNINAPNALIVTNNQSGGSNTIINKVNIADPKIYFKKIKLNEKNENGYESIISINIDYPMLLDTMYFGLKAKSIIDYSVVLRSGGQVMTSSNPIMRDTIWDLGFFKASSGEYTAKITTKILNINGFIYCDNPINKTETRYYYNLNRTEVFKY